MQQGSEQQAMHSLIKATRELAAELRQTAMENAALLDQNCQVAAERLMVLKECALMGDDERLSSQAERFSSEHLDYCEDASKLLRHVARGEQLQIRARHAQINVRIFGPQVAVAAAALCADPGSKAARCNLDNFCAMWKHLAEDVAAAALAVGQEMEKQEQQQMQQLLGAPVILKQPPTPGREGSPQFPNPQVQQQQQQQQQQPGDVVPPRSPDRQLEVLRQNQSFLGKFHKSVPNLSVTAADGGDFFFPGGGGGMEGMGAMAPHMGGVGDGGGGGGNFLDPHQHPSMMEPRRHSTSSVMPGQYPPKAPASMMMGMVPPVLDSSGRPVAAPGSGGNLEFVSPEEALASYKDVDNNEIVTRARKMLEQASDMVDFTRGCSEKVRTTQDLFTAAEFLAEEANLLYKVARLFSYDVPAGEDKRSLMAIADHVPKHCHRLRALIQSPTVGKAATFTKVDSIIKEARQVVLLVARVCQTCYANAKKYNLDFSNVSAEGGGRGTSGSSDSEAFGGSGAGGAGGAGAGGSGGDSS